MTAALIVAVLLIVALGCALLEAVGKALDGRRLAKRRADTLAAIAACETPRANATVRKMARMAREG